MSSCSGHYCSYHPWNRTLNLIGNVSGLLSDEKVTLKIAWVICYIIGVIYFEELRGKQRDGDKWCWKHKRGWKRLSGSILPILWCPLLICELVGVHLRAVIQRYWAFISSELNLLCLLGEVVIPAQSGVQIPLRWITAGKTTCNSAIYNFSIHLISNRCVCYFYKY